MLNERTINTWAQFSADKRINQMEKHTVLIVGGTTGTVYGHAEVSMKVVFWYHDENGIERNAIGIIEEVLE